VKITHGLSVKIANEMLIGDIIAYKVVITACFLYRVGFLNERTYKQMIVFVFDFLSALSYVIVMAMIIVTYMHTWFTNLFLITSFIMNLLTSTEKNPCLFMVIISILSDRLFTHRLKPSEMGHVLIFVSITVSQSMHLLITILHMLMITPMFVSLVTT